MQNVLIRKLKKEDVKDIRKIHAAITKTAVKNAILAVRQIDMKLVDAQQARRILDRIVGYKLNDFVCKCHKFR